MADSVEMNSNDALRLFNDVVNGTNRFEEICVICSSVLERDYITNKARELLKRGFIHKVCNDTRPTDLRVFITFKSA